MMLNKNVSRTVSLQPTLATPSLKYLKCAALPWNRWTQMMEEVQTYKEILTKNEIPVHF